MIKQIQNKATEPLIWYNEYMEFKGYVQVYTGNGKGKTTAALGLALRAAGNGMKTYIAQFMKKREYNEIISIKKYLNDYIEVEQFGLPEFHHSGKVSKEERKCAMHGVEAVKKAIDSKKYNIVILDEVNVLLYFKIIDKKYILEIIKNKPENMELILTGRYAPEEIMEKADLITEMKEIKHYFTENVHARNGIEK